MLKKLLILLILLSPIIVTSQQDTILLMNYNMLNYSTFTNQTRYVDLRKILAQVKPDVVVACEIEDVAAAQLLLDSAFNKIGNGTYARANVVNINNGTNTINMLFYRTSKVGLKSQTSIGTNLRDIAQYRIFKKLNATDTAYLWLHMAHFKAGNSTSTNPTDETQRFNEASAFCAAITNIPANQNILLCGDLNLKESIEPAWGKLTSTCSRNFIDPINQVGTWNNNAFFINIHTQSTRSSANSGCCFGSTGGLDDRFDFILGNAPVINGSNRAKILSNTYKSFGNDGQHFNLALVEGGANTSVPAAVNQALFNMSDHLPVIAKILVSTSLVNIKTHKDYKPFTAFYNFFSSTQQINLESNEANLIDFVITDISGRVILNKKIESVVGNNIYELNDVQLKTGIYFAHFSTDNYHTNIVLPIK